MNFILRYTIFKSDPYGNGADKRTSQISELLRENNIKWEIIPSGTDRDSFTLAFISKLFQTISAFIKVLFIIRRVCDPLSMYRTTWLVSHFMGVFSVSKTKEHRAILWESPKMDFSYVVPLFHKKGYSIISLPHNIESLVPSQRSAVTNRISPYWLLEEIRVLKKCEHVFAISKEETLFLKQLGVDAKYLPYYPPEEIYLNLRRIREKREKRSHLKAGRKTILLLGSAVNPPTREGMINRIKLFNKPGNDFCDIIVAGFGTGGLGKLKSEQGNITFTGELTNDQLSDILNEIDALLIYQPATSGALTRIVEALIAGVPVLANFESARNYYGTDGVYVYNDDEQLFNYIKGSFQMPAIPVKPLSEYKDFLKTVNEYTN